MTIVILEVHPKKKLEHCQPEVCPHGIAETKPVAVHPSGGAIYPEAENHEYGSWQDKVDHVNVSEGKWQSAALQLVSCHDAESTDYGVDM